MAGKKQTPKDTHAMAKQLLDASLHKMILPKVEQMATQSGIDLQSYDADNFQPATAMVAVAMEMALDTYMPRTEHGMKLYHQLKKRWNPDADR